MELKNLKIEQIPFFRICLFYLSGIMIGSQFPWTHKLYYSVLLLFLLIFLSILFFHSLSRNFIKQGLLYLSLLILGIINIATALPKVVPDLKEQQEYIAEIIEEPIVKGQVIRCKIQLLRLIDSNHLKPVNLQLLATIWDPDNLGNHFLKGDIIKFQGEIKTLEPPYNPQQFDYGSYLKGKGIFYQVFIPNNQLIVLKKGKDGIFDNWITGIREYLNT